MKLFILRQFIQYHDEHETRADTIEFVSDSFDACLQSMIEKRQLIKKLIELDNIISEGMETMVYHGNNGNVIDVYWNIEKHEFHKTLKD